MQTWLKRNRQLILRGGGSLLSALLLAVLIAQNWDELTAAIRQVSLTDLLLAFGLILCSRMFTAVRWYTLLRAGGVPISFRNTLSLTFTGLFANNFLPTTVGGDMVKMAGAMQMGYDKAVCLASLAADRLINMAGMSLAAPLGLVQLVQAAPLAGQSLTLGALWQKGWGFIRRTLASLTIWLKKPLSLLLALAFALAHMLCMFSANYILLNALGSPLPLWRVIGLFSLSYFAGLLPISINGYGWQELTTTTLLSAFGGVGGGVSAAVAVLHRLLMMTASLPGAFTMPGILSRMDKS